MLYIPIVNPGLYALSGTNAKNYLKDFTMLFKIYHFAHLAFTVCR